MSSRARSRWNGLTFRRMLKAEVNELLTQTRPGTPTGELFRHYWLPALLAEELPENDCPPVRGRERGSSWAGGGGDRPPPAPLPPPPPPRGEWGLIDDFCAHRGASL